MQLGMRYEVAGLMRHALFAIILSAASLLAAPAHAQQSRCADCHFANPDSPRQDHLQMWDRSPHGRNNVGCEKCHGGDATEFMPLLAHRGILAPGNDSSPVNRRNLPTTCGGCHIGPFVAFQDSAHYQLLKMGSPNGPTCSTCHGDVDGRLLSPKNLASQCNECHGPGEVAPRAQRAQQVREQYEGLRTGREEVKLAQSLIKRVSDRRRRADLSEQLAQAQVPVTRAVNAGHKFVYDDLKENLDDAQKRIDALMAALTNR